MDGQKADKAGPGGGGEAPHRSAGAAALTWAAADSSWQAALEHFAIDVAGKVCLDIGSSTGGFTDCLLQDGAARVHAVDVGTGQLDWKLRNDPRVGCTKGINARYLTLDEIGEPWTSPSAMSASFR